MNRPTRRRLPRLTHEEVSALLHVAGDADAAASVECLDDDDEAERTLRAFESAMDKLRAMCARNQGKEP